MKKVQFLLIVCVFLGLLILVFSLPVSGVNVITPPGAQIHDSLDVHWEEFTAGGTGMPADDFNDSLESQVHFSPKLYLKIDTTSAKIPTATLADSANGGAIRSETSKLADSTSGGAARAEVAALADSATGGAARAEVAALADSTTGGAARATTAAKADSTTGGAARATTSALADSCAGGAARAEVADDLDLIGWALETVSDSLRVDQDSINRVLTDSLNAYLDASATQTLIDLTLEDFTTYTMLPVIEDSLDEYPLTTLVTTMIEDSLDGYFTSTAVKAEIGDSLTEYLTRVQFKDSLNAAAYLDSSNITTEGITPDDMDSTDNDFVFNDVFRGTSALAESVMVTVETVEDSLKLVGRVAGQAWTGAHDFGGATSTEIVNAAAPTVDAEGELAWETDDDDLHMYDGATDIVIAARIQTRSFVIAAPGTTHDFPFWQTKRQIVITLVSAIAKGGTSVIGALDEWSATASAVDAAVDADWTITTTEFTTTDFDNSGLEAGDWLGWHTTSVSGTVDFLCLTVEYYER